jgi:hypothetical protein
MTATFIFGGFSVIACIWTYFCLPETKGRTFEQLDHMFDEACLATKVTFIRVYHVRRRERHNQSPEILRKETNADARQASSLVDSQSLPVSGLTSACQRPKAGPLSSWIKVQIQAMTENPPKMKPVLPRRLPSSGFIM